MNAIPQYLMDQNGFYWNPECPDHNLRFSPGLTAEDIRKVRIPVRIFRNGELVIPGTNLPKDIRENTRTLPA